MTKKRIRFFLDMLFAQGMVFITFDECFLYPFYRGVTMAESRLILGGLVLGMMVIITINKEKPKFEFEDILLGLFPYGCYYLMSIFRYYPGVVIVSCALILLCLAIAVVAWKTDRHAHARSLQVRKRYRKKVIKAVSCGATYILIVALVGTELVTTFSCKLPSIKRNETIQELRQSQVYDLSEDDEILAKLEYSIWKDLSDCDKLAVLQHVAEIEQIYLGIPTENILTVQKSILEPQTLGQFRNSTYEIRIQADHLREDSGFWVLCTVLHECHHAAARAAVESLEELPEEYQSLYPFRDIVQYRNDEENYISEGPGYAEQKLEVDAEEYAQTRVKDYLVLFTDKEEN